MSLWTARNLRIFNLRFIRFGVISNGLISTGSLRTLSASAMLLLNTIVLQSGGAPESASAEENPVAPASSTPFCLGYNPNTKTWGNAQLSDQNPEILCGDGQAFLGLSFGPKRLGRSALRGYCCPLPRGALLAEFQWVRARCPENWVITGARIPQKGDETLRCSKVDQQQFRLLAEATGVRVEIAEDFPLRFRDRLRGTGSPRLPRNALPAALRFGLGRNSRNSWEPSFCLGSPPGSILVGLEGNSCETAVFQDLLASSEKKSMSTQLLDCRALTNPYDPNASCVAP